jgi:hypothetical protein
VPGSLRGPVRWITDPLQFKVFADLPHAVRTGQPVALEGRFFDALDDDPQHLHAFNDAMSGMSAAINEAIVSSSSFDGAAVVVDVGGGHGSLLASILCAWPHLRGVLFEKATVAAGAKETLVKARVDDRCEIVSGDFHDHIGVRGDVFVLKHVLHDWPDDRAVAILRNVRTALDGGARGRLLVIEAVIGDGDGPSYGKFIDLAMLALVGGRERTAAEFAALLEQGGFELIRVIPTRSSVSVIEARPR